MTFGVNYADKTRIWACSQKYWPKSNFGQNIRYKTPNDTHKMEAPKLEPTFMLDKKWSYKANDIDRVLIWSRLPKILIKVEFWLKFKS